MKARRLTQIRNWSDHPEDMSLLGPSPADVGVLLDERDALLSALKLQAWRDDPADYHFTEACAAGRFACPQFCVEAQRAIAKAAR